MSSSEAAVPLADETPQYKYDYVIVYNSQSSDSTIIDLLKTKLKAQKLAISEITSEENPELVYLVITAPREVLISRAQEVRVSVPIRSVRVVDMMAVQTEDTECNRVRNVDVGYRRKVVSKSRGEEIVEFIRDWFRPTLIGGHIKFDYQRKYDELLFCKDPENDPFTNFTRIRSGLVHDLIKDIELTRDLQRMDHEEARSDKTDHRYVYRGLEWMKKRGYVKKSFVPHSEKDRARCETIRREKHHRFPIQSVTSIREYLGEKVAFSFAWRSAWLSCGLTLPAIIGFFVFLAGIILHIIRGSPSGESTGRNETRSSAQYGWFDNEILPFYSIVVLLLQIILFAYGWSRYKFIYSFKWGMLNYFLVNERQLVMNKNLNDLTKDRKLWSKIKSQLVGITALLGTVVLNFAVFFVQQIFRASLSTNKVMSMSDNVAFYLSTVCVSLVNTMFVVLVLNRWFAKFAKQLCDKEYHTFPSDYERSLTWKVFFYSFAANNLRLLMMTVVPQIVFPFSIPHVNHPGEKFVMEFCEEGKCVTTISIQLIFFLLFKPLTSLLGHHKDSAIRKGKRKMRQWRHWWQEMWTCAVRQRTRYDTVNSNYRLDNEAKRLDKEYHLYESDRFGERNQTLMDMNDRVAQYGFVIMFGAVMPLSPLIAAIVEIIMKQLDVQRYTNNQRRPVPRRYEGVGCWEEIVDLVNALAMFTNVWIVVYRSTFAAQSNYPPVLSVALLGSIIFFVFLVRAMTQVTSIPEKVKRFQHEEVGAVEVFLKHFSNQATRDTDAAVHIINEAFRDDE